MIKFRPQFEFLLVYTVTLGLLALILAPMIVVILGSFLNMGLVGITSDQWSGARHQLVSLDAFTYLFSVYWEWMLFSMELALHIGDPLCGRRCSGRLCIGSTSV